MSSVSCSEFVNDMTHAREVGLSSERAYRDLSGWWQHTLGFVTGYNLGSPDMHDLVSGARGDSMEDLRTTLLTIADIYCRENLTSDFSGALRAIRDRLLPTADLGTP